jgi:hypothetical protein
MKQRLTSFLLLLLLCASAVSAQETKGGTNLLMIRGEKYKEGATIVLTCTNECCTIDNEKKVITMTMDGKLGEKNVRVSLEVPIVTGTQKIKLDKDGDLGNNQKMTIEIFGSNPAVDKDVYEIQDEKDDAIIAIMSADEVTKKLEGTFSAKYFDSATDIKKLSATCHFLIGPKE